MILSRYYRQVSGATSSRLLRQSSNIRSSKSTQYVSGTEPSLLVQSCSPSLQRLFFSAEATPSTEAAVSKYEYPTRTEAPSITSTKAIDIASKQSQTPSKVYLSAPDDPFNDSNTLSHEERDQLRQKQSKVMESFKLSSLPITSSVPDFIPPNVSPQELEAPETLITTLANGIRVVSQETYSQMCTVGVLTNVGSRHETVTGTVHCLETMAFGSTQQFDGLQITQMLQDWGASRFVSHSREQTLHCVDILRPNVHQGMNLLSQVVLSPMISESPMEVEYAKEVMKFQAQEQLPELQLGEALQVAAYGSDQQLGKLHFATPESIAHLSAPLVEDFYQRSIRNNPKGMVVAGAGIGHDELVDMAKEHFGVMEQKSGPTIIPSTYRGGSHFIENHSSSQIHKKDLPGQQQCKVALAFPVGGWHSDSLVTACVLQTLLGGGSSFSAGGPGKGMYSRMYQQVLNRYGWMETAEAFTTFADEGGLFGVSASTADESKVPQLVTVLADQLARVALQPVGGMELSRARNMLKCNVLTQLESRLILFEDMGRQVLTYGKREDAATTCQKIDAVTAEDIQKLALGMLQNHPPTLAATGSHLKEIPNYDDVCHWFR